MEGWLVTEERGEDERGSGWGKWKCLVASCLSVSPSLPSPTYSLVSLLICHFLISSPPSSSSSSSLFPTTLCSLPRFSSPTYLICIHLLPDQMCHRTTNYLICLLPLSLPLLHLSPPLLHYLLLRPFLKPSFPPIPASSPPPDNLSRSLLPSSSLPQSHPCLPRSLRTLAETFCLILWPLKNCWSNSAAHPIIVDRGRGKGRDEGRKIRSEGVGWNTEWREARTGYGGRKEYRKLRGWREMSPSHES